MSIVKPFTFVSGTKAKAGEVNDNFDVLYTQVNANISELAQINIDIDNIGLNKADINGNSTQRFSVADAVNNTDAVNKQYMLENSLPTGLILYLAVEDIPTGYLLCDGSTVSRSTYSNLYAALGTKYGAGDGTTTFSIPDLIGRYPKGASVAGTELDAAIPNITGSVNGGTGWFDNATGAFVATNTGGDWDGYGSRWLPCSWNFSASRSSSVYKDGVTTVQPPSLELLPLIKY
jgi:hypothetical protein